MFTHPIARLTTLGREWPLRRHIDHSEPLPALIISVIVRKDDAPAAGQAAMNTVGNLMSISGSSGLIHSTSG